MVTARELARLPDDGFRYELIRGELVRMAPASPQHGEICANVVRELSSHVRERKLGKVYDGRTGFLLARNPDTVRCPDAAVVLKARAGAEQPGEPFFQGAPDLAVEVVSPGDSFQDVVDKVEMWLASGVRSVWVIDPRRRRVSIYTGPAQVQHFELTDVIPGDPVLPDLALPVSRLFPE